MIQGFTIQYSPPWYNSFLETVKDGKGGVYRKTFARSKGKCQLCGGACRFIHPIFTLDKQARLYRLSRFISVCETCGDMLRLSSLSEKEEEVVQYWSHLLKRPKRFMALEIERAWTRYAYTSSFTFDWGDLGILHRPLPKGYIDF